MTAYAASPLPGPSLRTFVFYEKTFLVFWRDVPAGLSCGPELFSLGSTVSLPWRRSYADAFLAWPSRNGPTARMPKDPLVCWAHRHVTFSSFYRTNEQMGRGFSCSPVFKALSSELIGPFQVELPCVGRASL